MRQSPTSKRGRGRSGGRRSYANNANRSYDSSGPDAKVRGTANHIYDKYLVLARDASSSGDRVMAENYLQHAEHYFRIINANNAAQAQAQAQANNQGQGNDQGQAQGNNAGQGQPDAVNGKGRGNGQQPQAEAVDEARTITPEQSGPTMFQPIQAEQPVVAEPPAADRAPAPRKRRASRARDAAAPSEEGDDGKEPDASASG